MSSDTATSTQAAAQHASCSDWNHFSVCQDMDAEVNWGIDRTQWCLKNGVTVQSANWTVPAQLDQLQPDGIAGYVAWQRIAAGAQTVSGITYQVTVDISYSDGQKEKFRIDITFQDVDTIPP